MIPVRIADAKGVELLKMNMFIVPRAGEIISVNGTGGARTMFLVSSVIHSVHSAAGEGEMVHIISAIVVPFNIPSQGDQS